MSSGRRNGTCRTPFTFQTQPSFTLSGGSSGRAGRRWRKVFGSIAADLKQQRAVFVGVVVGRDDLPFARAVVTVFGEAVVAQPLPRIGDALALEQVEDAAAFLRFVVSAIPS